MRVVVGAEDAVGPHDGHVQPGGRAPEQLLCKRLGEPVVIAVVRVSDERQVACALHDWAAVEHGDGGRHVHQPPHAAPAARLHQHGNARHVDLVALICRSAVDTCHSIRGGVEDNLGRGNCLVEVARRKHGALAYAHAAGGRAQRAAPASDIQLCVVKQILEW
jgi:hypothetical protein